MSNSRHSQCTCCKRKPQTWEDEEILGKGFKQKNFKNQVEIERLSD